MCDPSALKAERAPVGVGEVRKARGLFRGGIVVQFVARAGDFGRRRGFNCPYFFRTCGDSVNEFGGLYTRAPPSTLKKHRSTFVIGPA